MTRLPGHDPDLPSAGGSRRGPPAEASGGLGLEGRVPAESGLIGPRLLSLFAAGLLLLNFPLLALWDHRTLVMGLPLFPAALFAVWGALILVLALLMERLPDGD